MTAKPRHVREQRKSGTFTEADNRRLAEVCVALGTSIPEFVHFAVMQAVGEVEGLAHEMSAIARAQPARPHPRPVARSLQEAREA